MMVPVNMSFRLVWIQVLNVTGRNLHLLIEGSLLPLLLDLKLMAKYLSVIVTVLAATSLAERGGKRGHFSSSI